VVERYHMVEQTPVAGEPRGTGGFRGDDDAVDRTYKGKVLRVDFTVEDAGTFNMPWSRVVVYNRARAVSSRTFARRTSTITSWGATAQSQPRRARSSRVNEVRRSRS
jgi:hypothetical protein